MNLKFILIVLLVLGISRLSFYVNEAPVNGNCSLQLNGTVQRWAV